jgi:hypothetical protein
MPPIYKKHNEDFEKRNCPLCDSSNYESIDSFYDMYGIDKSMLNYISKYLDNIKKTAYIDSENLENLVLYKDLNSDFVKNFLFKRGVKRIKKTFIVKHIFIFYLRSMTKLFLYSIEYMIFKIFGKKSDVNWDQNLCLIDVYFLVNNIVKDGKFQEKYFGVLYEVLKKYNKNYIFLPRIYKDAKNPFKLIKLFNITNKDSCNTFLYEYELLDVVDIFKIFIFIIRYPFKQFKLMQNNGHEIDAYFNYELFNVLSVTSFSVYVRYLIGKKIAGRVGGNLKIISWQEFQGIEKSFNKAIKESSKNIVIYGCELLVGYQAYINMHITDVDVDLKITPHQTLLNGRCNYSNSKSHVFRKGVSLRYSGLFKYTDNIKKNAKPLALMGYDISEGLNILKSVSFLEDLNIKIHPTTNEKQFHKYKKCNWNYIYSDLYEALQGVSVVFTPSFSGTALEVVAYGVSTVIIASESSLTNPLVSYGKGEIWDIAFNSDDARRQYNELLEYRNHNPKRVRDVACWYKENFFIEPTEENIVKAFELG